MCVPTVMIIRCKIYFVFFIFVVYANHENIFTTKISRSTVYGTQYAHSGENRHDCIMLNPFLILTMGLVFDVQASISSLQVPHLSPLSPVLTSLKMTVEL